MNLWVKSNNVTQKLTWPFDSQWVTFYLWSVVTMRLFCTVTKMWSLKNNGVSTLTFFWVTWRHWSRDHSTRHMWFSIGGPLWPCVYFASNLHLPMLKAKSSLRMRRVTWPVGRGSKITAYLEFPGHIAYSLCHIGGATMTIKGCL